MEPHGTEALTITVVVVEPDESWVCPADSAPGWDAIDQASWESFPASDPPSWSPAHATPSEAPPEEDVAHVHAPNPVSPV